MHTANNTYTHWLGKGIMRSIVATLLLVLVASPIVPLIAQAQTQTTSETQKATEAKMVDRNQSASSKWCVDAASCISGVVYIFTAGLGSAVAYVSASFLNFAVSLSLNSQAYSLDFIATGWSTVRDIASMAFLFIILYIGFIIIFRAETSSTLSMLARTIIIALLINFSFFLTRVVIDIGNILAIQFYNAIMVSGVGGVGGTATKDLTSSIMGALELQNLFNTPSFQQLKDAGFFAEIITLVFLYIAVGIMYAMLAISFFLVGIKFMVRIVVLWFAIIAAPLAFIARTMDNTSQYYDEWQDILIKHSFYPAVFLFMFKIITTFMSAIGGGGTGSLTQSILSGAVKAEGSASGIAAIGINIANVGIRMGFVIIMLYFGLKIADSVGVYGAKMAKSATSSVINLAAGGAGMVGRRTVGWAGQRVADNTTVRNNAAKGGMLSRTLWRGASAIGKSSFDVRASGAARSSLAALDLKADKAGGIGGYAREREDKVARRTGEAERLAPTMRQLQETQAKILANKTAEEKATILTATTNLESARTRNTLENTKDSRLAAAEAQKQFNAVLKPVVEESKEVAGAKNPEKYAESITKKDWRNAWGAQNAGVIPQADKEAAARIRAKGMGDNEKLLSVVKSVLEKQKQTAPAKNTPTNTLATDLNSAVRREPPKVVNNAEVSPVIETRLNKGATDSIRAVASAINTLNTSKVADTSKPVSVTLSTSNATNAAASQPQWSTSAVSKGASAVADTARKTAEVAIEKGTNTEPDIKKVA